MAYSMGYTVDSALKGQASYCLGLFFPPSVSSLDEGLARSDSWVSFYSFRFLPLLRYNCVFYIHKILGRMDELGHGLRLFLVKLVDE